MEQKLITIDAEGKKLGRLATQVAVTLRGKNKPGFRKNVLSKQKVTVTNASKMDIDERRLVTLTHKRYSGYPGGLKELTGKEVVSKKGYKALLEHAVSGMLPKNKHRKLLMQHLTITD